jgi:hypothetical protein
MLVQSNYNINDVVTLKLANGEELVGKLTNISDTEVTLTRPLVFTLNPQNGSAMLVPWLMSVDPRNAQPISINRANVLAITKTIKEISNNYTQATTGIAVANTGDFTNFKI